MSMTEQQLFFPVVAINKNNMHFSRNADDLTICTKVALNNRFFDKMEIIDSKGNTYKVLSYDKVATVGLFWGYNIFLNQKIRVQLNLAEIINTSINDFRKKIIRLLKKNELIDISVSNEVYKRIEASNSFEEVIKLLTEYYFGVI